MDRCYITKNNRVLKEQNNNNNNKDKCREGNLVCLSMLGCSLAAVLFDLVACPEEGKNDGHNATLQTQ